MYKLASFFSGTGGIEIPFSKHNHFKIVFFNEYDDGATKCLNINFPNTKIYNKKIEILDHSIENFDILTAGFPCQPFSIAGLRKGFEDYRCSAIKKLIEIIEIKKPKIIFLENVKNIINYEDFHNNIIKKLNNIGYHIKYKILNTKDFGIPQNRERIYIIGFLNKDQYKNFNFPTPFNLKNSIFNYIKDSKEVKKKYFYNKNNFKHFEKIKEILKDRDLETFYQWRRVYLRKNKSGVCPTLTANMGTGGNNVPIIKQDNMIRKLIPAECFLLQGFPKNYKIPNLSDSKLYKLAGNAVSVIVIEKIVEELNKII